MISNLAWRTCLLASTTTAIAVIGISTAAWAQEAPLTLDPIDVMAAGEGTGGATALTTTTRREELTDRMIEDMSDLSRRIDASVNFSSRLNTINLRGLDQNRVLTTIDGIRVPWLTDPRESAQGGLNAFDFDTLSAIDITRGADSTRYGSGVLGGAVSLYTLDPEDLLTDGRQFGTLVKGSYDSADQSWRSNAAMAARFNDTYFLLQGGYRIGHERENMGTIGGYGSTRTMANPEDYDQGNLLAKVHQYFGPHRFGLTGELFDRDRDIDDRTGTTDSYEIGSLRSGDRVRRQRLSASYDFVSPDGADWIDEAHVTGYWLRQRINRTTNGIRLRDPRADIIPGDPFFYGVPTGIYRRDNELQQTSYGISGDAVKEFDVGGVANRLRFGGELYRQDTQQYSAGVDNCPDVNWNFVPSPFGPQACTFLHSNESDMPDVESLVFGIYAENDILIPNSNVTLTPGVRFDWYEHNPRSTPTYESGSNFDGTLPDSNSDARLTGKVRAAWQATNELEVYAQWAQAFRAPSALELYQDFGAPGSYARIGNPDLDPETSNGFELGASYDTDLYGVSASVFNNYYRNFIDQVQIAPPGGEYPIGGIVGYENRNRVQIFGAELRGHWNFAPQWRTWGSLAWSQGRDTDEDEYLNSIPPLRAIAGLGYEAANWGADVSVTMAAARNKVGDGGFQAPGYGILDLTGWWEPEQLNGLRVQAGVFNVFDKKYWNAIDVPNNTSEATRDRFTETGRSFRVSISHRF